MVGQVLPEARLDGAFVPTPVPGVVAVDADGEAVLVDEVTDQLHLLNATAALVWACFDGEASIADIAFDVADVLGAPFEQILTDTLGVVAGLVSRGVCYDGRATPPTRPAAGRDHHETPDQSLGVPRRPRLLEEPPNG